MPKCSQRFEVEGLATDYPAGAWIETHAHEAHQVIHASTGVMRVVSNTASWVVPPGRAIWMPAGRSHAIRCHTAVEMRTVYLSGRSPGFPGDCQVWAVSPLMREIAVRISTGPDAKQLVHLVALLLAEIETIDSLPLVLPAPQDLRLRRLTDALSDDPADGRALTEWARDLGLSERSLIRRFHAETGLTFRQWRRQARLLAALERLAANEPVTTVAFAVGYDSVSAFISAFRDAFGETPRRYYSEKKIARA